MTPPQPFSQYNGGLPPLSVNVYQESNENEAPPAAKRSKRSSIVQNNEILSSIPGRTNRVIKAESSPATSESMDGHTTTTDGGVTSEEEKTSRSSSFSSGDRRGHRSNPLSPEAAALANDTSQLIYQDAKFMSIIEFEDAFERWKRQYMHPFRVASSESLREADGKVNHIFKYRYVVFHCAHYGEPRMRGIGKRPNQNYLPCGCKAMLRVNYSFTEKCLKVTTLNPIHNDHELSLEMYQRVTQKCRKSFGEGRKIAKASRKSEVVMVTTSAATPKATPTVAPVTPNAPPQTNFSSELMAAAQKSMALQQQLIQHQMIAMQQMMNSPSNGTNGQQNTNGTPSMPPPFNPFFGAPILPFGSGAGNFFPPNQMLNFYQPPAAAMTTPKQAECNPNSPVSSNTKEYGSEPVNVIELPKPPANLVAPIPRRPVAVKIEMFDAPEVVAKVEPIPQLMVKPAMIPQIMVKKEPMAQVELVPSPPTLEMQKPKSKDEEMTELLKDCEHLIRTDNERKTEMIEQLRALKNHWSKA